MSDKISDLIRSIDAYLNGDLDSVSLENITMSVIEDDNFDSLNDDVQELIYALDSKELNDLSKTDIQTIKTKLVTYIST